MIINKKLDNFKELGISDYMCDILNKLNYFEPFLIQKMCIPEILNNFDVLGIANTGCGKTIAYILPFLEKINKKIKNSQVLILEPTRELAIQVSKVILSFIKYIKWINIITIYGGKKIDFQINLLKKNTQHIIVGTPGRIIDHIKRNTIDLSNIYNFIIDEADEMLKMGFIDNINNIVSFIPKNRQTLLFSATMPDSLKKISLKFMRKNFKEIIVNKKNNINPNIYQYYINTFNKIKKEYVLLNFLLSLNFYSILIFVNTKLLTVKIYNILKKFNYNCMYLNGDMKQNSREKTINLFKEKKISILIATDIASRGIDIDKLDWVINFDIPNDENTYIHRIGRTGRAGNYGKSLSIVNIKDFNVLKSFKNIYKIIKKYNLLLDDKLEKYKLVNLSNLVKNKYNINNINNIIYKSFIDELLNILNNNKYKLIDILISIIINN